MRRAGRAGAWGDRAVELVDDELRGEGALLDAALGRRELRRPRVERSVERPGDGSDAHFAIAGQLTANVESAASVAHVVAGETLAALEQVDDPALQFDPRCHEEKLPGIERLVELARER